MLKAGHIGLKAAVNALLLIEDPPTGLLLPFHNYRCPTRLRVSPKFTAVMAPLWFVISQWGQVSLPFMGIAPPIELGSLGMADSLILMVMALVVFGPRRLPQIGRQIGKLMYEFRKASNDFKFQMEEELRLSEEAERRKKEEEKRKQIPQESVSATPAVVNATESPYPGEGQYPDLKAAESKPADETPRILPPSTGEPVAVGSFPAGSLSEQAELTEPSADVAAPAATNEKSVPSATVSPNG
jgi:sec-independent protein translocase protein TatB